MDTRMILAGRAPDVMGSYGRGLEVGQFGNQVRQENALRSLYAAQGPQILAGQPNALNALATLSPGLAMDAQGAILNQQQTRQDMAFSAEEMQMRRDQAARQAEEWAMNKSAAEVAAEAQKTEQWLKGVLPYVAKARTGDAQAQQAVDQIASQMGMTEEDLMGMIYSADAVYSIYSRMLDDQPKPAEAPTFRAATPEEAAQYGAQAGQIDTKTGRFYPNNPPSNTVIEQLPGGGMRVVQGPGAGAATKEQRRVDMAQTSGDVITTAADRAMEAFKGLSPLGSAGVNVFAWNPMTDSAELVRQVNVLKSNATISALQAMREASPTGGALGSVTERENAMLAEKAGALDPTSPNFPRDLADYTRTLLQTVHGREAGDALYAEWATKNGIGGQPTAPADPAQGATPAPGTVLRFDAQGNLLP